MHRPGDLQKQLEVSASTLRHWSNTFADFLSPSARPSTTENGGPAQRRFTDGDVAVLTTIKHLLADGLTYDAIKDRLSDPEATFEPSAEPAAVVAVPQQQNLPEALAALTDLTRTQQEALTALRDLVAVQREQNELLKQQATTESLVAELTADREARRAETETLRSIIDELRVPWWKRIFQGAQ